MIFDSLYPPGSLVWIKPVNCDYLVKKEHCQIGLLVRKANLEDLIDYGVEQMGQNCYYMVLIGETMYLYSQSWLLSINTFPLSDSE